MVGKKNRFIYQSSTFGMACQMFSGQELKIKEAHFVEEGGVIYVSQGLLSIWLKRLLSDSQVSGTSEIPHLLIRRAKLSSNHNIGGPSSHWHVNQSITSDLENQALIKESFG